MRDTIIRSSERATFERCKAKWWWSWREGLVPRRPRLGALWFGEGVHLCHARWYTGPGLKRGVEMVETWEEWTRDALAYVKTQDATDEQVAQYEDAATLGRVMLEGYRARYGIDEHVHVIQPEHSFSIQIPYPDWQQFYVADEGDILATLTGTYDLAYRDLRDSHCYLRECKTAKAISTRHLGIDNQAGTYWATATGELQKRGILKSREVLHGIEYDFLRKALPDERPRDAEGYATNKPVKADYVMALETLIPGGSEGKPWDKHSLKYLETAAAFGGVTVLGERSKLQPPPLYLRHMVHRTRPERRAQLLRAQDQAMEMELFRRGELAITKNPTRDCAFCEFQDICELQERGGDWKDLRDLTFRAEDPYAAHRPKSAAAEEGG